MFISYIDSVIYDSFPEKHACIIAYNKYKLKGLKSLDNDCLDVYNQHKKFIDKNKTSWLTDSIVYIGTKASGIYFSMLYNKLKTDKIIKMFVKHVHSVKNDLPECKENVVEDFPEDGSDSSSSDKDSSGDSSSESDSSSDTEECSESPLDVIKSVYQGIQPQLNEIIAKMEIPPPNGVILSSKNKKTREDDLTLVKKSISDFEKALK